MAKKKTTKKKDTKAEPKEKTTKPEPEPVTPEKIVHKKIKVSFWRTSLHGEELGIYQEMKYQAKTRYFSKGFDIEGLVSEDNEKKYILAYNKDEFQEAPRNEPVRLILRIFTIMEEKLGVGTGGNFHGGIELSITHSLIQSYEVLRPAIVFFVQLPRIEELIRIVKGWRLIGDRWSWPLLPEKKEDQLQMVYAKSKHLSIGRNYDIYIGKKKIAHLDHQPVQKEAEIEIWDEDYAKDLTFVRTLLLFGAMTIFMKDIHKKIKKVYKKMKKSGTTVYKPNKQELDLFKNPRLMRK